MFVIVILWWNYIEYAVDEHWSDSNKVDPIPQLFEMFSDAMW